MEDKRYWIKQTRGRRTQSPEEIADLMFLAKGQRSMIANREVPSIEERITESGHIFKYRPIQGITPTGASYKDYIKEYPGELSDAERSDVVESMFNMYDRELSRLRKKSATTKKIIRKKPKRIVRKNNK